MSYEQFESFDLELLSLINNERVRSLDPYFRFITETITPLTVVVIIGFVVYAIVKKEYAAKRIARTTCFGLLLVGTISTTLKYSIRRERPGDVHHFIESIAPNGGYSFPSGHTCSAFGLATLMVIAFRKWYVIIPSCLLACAIGYSRMHLGVHYPSDVLAGVIIGSGSILLWYKLDRWLVKDKTGNN